MVQITNFYLQDFMSQLKDGARPNQFLVDMVVPAAMKGLITDSTEAEGKIRFMAKATSIPASVNGKVEVPFRGRQFKIAGDRTFNDWTVTVTNDTDFLVRNMMEQWSDLIVGNVNHDTFSDTDSPLDYMSSGDVLQLSRNGSVIKQYKFIGIWPVEIGEISLGHDQNDTIEEFDVTFAVQWWESDTTRNNTEANSFSRVSGQPVI